MCEKFSSHRVGYSTTEYGDCTYTICWCCSTHRSWIQSLVKPPTDTVHTIVYTLYIHNSSLVYTICERTCTHRGQRAGGCGGRHCAYMLSEGPHVLDTCLSLWFAPRFYTILYNPLVSFSKLVRGTQSLVTQNRTKGYRTPPHTRAQRQTHRVLVTLSQSVLFA